MTTFTQRISQALNRLVRHDEPRLDGGSAFQLLNQLALMSSRPADRPPYEVQFHGTRSPRQLNTSTRLDYELWSASRLRDGSVLMASPKIGDTSRFAATCVDHKIARVVDLRSAKEKHGLYSGPLDGGHRTVHDGKTTARFLRQGRAVPLKGSGSNIEDHVRSIKVSVAPGRQSSRSTDHASGERSQALEWVRIHTRSDKEISPQQLLDTSVHLVLTTPANGGKTAFQCADGQHTGATFAAAHALLQRHLRDPLRAEGLETAVLDECLKIRIDRGPELFRSSDLASLMAYGHLVLEADRRGALPPRALATPPPKPPHALAPPPPKPPRAPERAIRMGPPVPPKPLSNATPR